MAVRECERSVRCFPCADENPFANLSAEDPDLNIFLSVDFRRIPNPPHNNWTTNVCAAFCESSISQEDADDCARRKTFDCIVDPPPPNPDNPSWPTPIYCNQLSTCQTDGQCYTMPSGTVCAFSALEANALAQSLCNYRVHNPQITSACSSLPPQDPSEEPCPMESGAAAPDSLEISSESIWETIVVNPATFVDWPGNPAFKTQSFPNDHPPGHYDIAYVTGMFDGTDLMNPCDLGDPLKIQANVALYSVIDDNYNIDNLFSITSGLYDIDPPNEDHGFSGLGFCETDFAAAETKFQQFFNIGDNFQLHAPPDPTPRHRYKHQENHDNDGGELKLAFDSGALINFNMPVGRELTFKLIQFDGLIPQPRKVAISNYASLISQFADPAAAASWNGEFPERTVYSSMTVQWAVTAVGAFGGAVLRWTDAHPTSANGKGWMLEIFSAGAILLWRGFRAIGSTPLGRFQKDSTSTPSGPPCCDVADASDDVWYPGEAPP